MMFGLVLFFIGLHAVDNSWNLHTAECLLGDELVDTNVFGYGFGVTQAYTAGLLMMVWGMVVFGVSCVMYKRRSLR